MANNLDLKEVVERFKLYNTAFNKKPYINNLANELGVKTTTLMKFIMDNIEHFILFQNDKGTYISRIYMELKDKPGSKDFVEYNKEKYKDTLFLEVYLYPYTSDMGFHRLKVDERDEERSNEWRNTPEKIEKVKNFLSEKDVNCVSDKYSMEKYPDYISKENIELLMSKGWKFINYRKDLK